VLRVVTTDLGAEGSDLDTEGAEEPSDKMNS
jgi:hypothetical protein